MKYLEEVFEEGRFWKAAKYLYFSIRFNHKCLTFLSACLLASTALKYLLLGSFVLQKTPISVRPSQKYVETRLYPIKYTFSSGKFPSGEFPEGLASCPEMFYPRSSNIRPLSKAEIGKFAIVFSLAKPSENIHNEVRETVIRTRKWTDFAIVFLVHKDGIRKEVLVKLRKDTSRFFGVDVRAVEIPFLAQRHSAYFWSPRIKGATCCRITEYVKLQALALPFDKVIVLDMGVQVFKPLDHLLRCNYDFQFATGGESNENLGFLVLKTLSPEMFQELVDEAAQMLFEHESLKMLSGQGIDQTGRLVSMRSLGRRNITGAVKNDRLRAVESVEQFLLDYYTARKGASQFRSRPLSGCLYDHGELQGPCKHEVDQHGFPVAIQNHAQELVDSRMTLTNKAHQKCAINVWILGARKGGSTSLYMHVTDHPDVFRQRLNGDSKDGEIFFRDFKAPNAHDEYNKLAGKSPLDERLAVDSLVARLVDDPWPLLSRCSHKSNKMLVLLRDPVERCHSEMLMRARLGVTGLDLNSNVSHFIERDLKEFERRTKGSLGWMKERIPQAFYVGGVNSIYEGIYAAHLRRWLYYIGRDNLHVIFTSDYQKNTVQVVADALDFIGLDTSRYNFSNVQERYNARPEETLPSNLHLPAALRKRLKEFYRPYDIELGRLLGTRIPWM